MLTPVLQDSYDKHEEITQKMTETNEKRFAQFALAAVNLGAVFEKNSEGQKATFASIASNNHEEAYQVAAAIFEKKHSTGKIRWSNMPVALDVLSRGFSVFGKFVPDDIPRELHVRGDSSLVCKEGKPW